MIYPLMVIYLKKKTNILGNKSSRSYYNEDGCRGHDELKKYFKIQVNNTGIQ